MTQQQRSRYTFPITPACGSIADDDCTRSDSTP